MWSAVKLFCELSCIFVLFQISLCYDDDSSDACEKDGVAGLCVILPNCAQYIALLKDKATTLEGVRVTQARQCGFEGLHMKVCCPTDSPTATTSTTLPPPPVDDFVRELPRPGSCGMRRPVYREVRNLNMEPEETEENDYPSGPRPTPDYDLTITDNPSSPRPTPGYDLTNTDDLSTKRYSVSGGKPVPRIGDYSVPAIAGGTSVENDSTLSVWMALLGYKDSSVLWKCGGTVITSRHVLTAAHCIKRNLHIVRLGEIDFGIDNKNKRFKPLDFLVKKKIVHEQYRKYHNDVAILVLDGDVDFYAPENRHIAPACLPSSADQERVQKLQLAHYATVIGWGETDVEFERPKRLQYANVEMQERTRCKDAFEAQNVTIDARVLCAGDAKNGRDACKGDSGGPLVTPTFQPELGATIFYQIGIVSYGFSCLKKRYIGAYANVTYFMPWIEEKVLGKPIRSGLRRI